MLSNVRLQQYGSDKHKLSSPSIVVEQGERHFTGAGGDNPEFVAASQSEDFS